MRKIILSLCLLALPAGALSAQGPVDERGGTATITINSLLHIDVSNLTVTFDAPTFDDFVAGSMLASSGSSVIGTRSNVVHDVTIEADAAEFTGTGTKPASDLQWSLDGSSWSGLVVAPGEDVLTALSRGADPNRATVAYRLLLNEETDLPGTYSLGFTYTVVAN